MRYHSLFWIICTYLVSAGCIGLEKTANIQEQGKKNSTGIIIHNLYDAFGKDNDQLIFDFGFSALIEYKGMNILFDSGTDANTLKHNVESLGVNLADIDFAIGSHSHSDHISGFDYLIQVNPDVKIYLPKDFFGLGAPITFKIAGTEPEQTKDLPEEFRYFQGEKEAVEIKPSGRFWQANIEYVTENISIVDGINLITTTSPFMGSYSKYPNLDANGNPSSSEASFIELPEISLALDSKEGQVLIVGCSHSTVEAIVRETLEYSKGKINLVMGGYHLIPYKSDGIQAIAQRLKSDLGVARVAPAHCTGHLAFKILSETYGENFIFAGLGSTIHL